MCRVLSNIWGPLKLHKTADFLQLQVRQTYLKMLVWTVAVVSCLFQTKGRRRRLTPPTHTHTHTPPNLLLWGTSRCRKKCSRCSFAWAQKEGIILYLWQTPCLLGKSFHLRKAPKPLPWQSQCLETPIPGAFYTDRDMRISRRDSLCGLGAALLQKEAGKKDLVLLQSEAGMKDFALLQLQSFGPHRLGIPIWLQHDLCQSVVLVMNYCFKYLKSTWSLKKPACIEKATRLTEKPKNLGIFPGNSCTNTLPFVSRDLGALLGASACIQVPCVRKA